MLSEGLEVLKEDASWVFGRKRAVRSRTAATGRVLTGRRTDLNERALPCESALVKTQVYVT